MSGWSAHDTALVVWAAVAIAAIVLLIMRFKVHPLLALLAGSAIVGAASGMAASKAVATFETGFGETLAHTGMLVGLGTMLGRMLADSGGADRIVDTILGWAGPKRVPWAMALIAMIIGIPMFFEVGVFLVLPVVFLMAKRANTSIVRVGIPALAGLSVMHGLVPPHPGPLIAISALGADLGRAMMFGLVVAIPSVIVAGPIFGGLVGKRVAPSPPAHLVEQFDRGPANDAERPGFGVTLGTVLLPVALMLARALASVALGPGRARAALELVGDPLVAMTAAVVVAMFTFGYLRGRSQKSVHDMLAASLEPIAGIVLIIGAGGGFKQMLVGGGIGDAIGKAATASAMSPLLLAWLLAAAVRVATGSATVATVTASGLVAPFLAHVHGVDTALVALAIGAGSLFLSHVNDAGFWLVKESFGMTVGETLATWSAMETLLSVVGIVLILLLGAVT